MSKRSSPSTNPDPDFKKAKFDLIPSQSPLADTPTDDTYTDDTPACPGLVKCRGNTYFGSVPTVSAAIEKFTAIRRDENLGDEEAFLNTLKTFNLSVESLLNSMPCRRPTQFLS